MSLFEADLGPGRSWMRVGDAYEITRKPRGLDRAALAEIPFAPMDAIPQGGAYDATFTMRAPSDIASGTYFEAGDILVSKITPSFENGKQAWVRTLPTPFGYATTEVIPLRPRSGGHDPRFLFFYLLHPDVRHFVAERMEGSTGRQRVPETVLLDLAVPDFDLEEQERIGAVLEVLHTAANHEALVGRVAEQLQRATRQRLFTRGGRGEEQKSTELGKVPVSWDVVPFREIRDQLQYGTSARCDYSASDYPVLRIPNIRRGGVDPEDLKYARLSAEEAAKYRLDVGDLLFIRTNGVVDRLGACAVYAGEPKGALFASYLIRARLDGQRIRPDFVAHFLSSETGAGVLAARATPAADGKFNLNTATIDSLPIPVPDSLAQQDEIVAILDAIDRKIDLHRRKRAVLEELFKSLLNNLMTGEIRVDGLDLSALDGATAEVSAG